MRRGFKVVLAGAAGALAGIAAWMIPGSRRIPPAERERRRRLLVNLSGRTGNATITDVSDGVLCYTYSAGGMEYAASQDVSALSGLLPADPATLIDVPATVKYLPRNPANSILLCEGWSGLFARPPAHRDELRPTSAE